MNIAKAFGAGGAAFLTGSLVGKTTKEESTPSCYSTSKHAAFITAASYPLTISQIYKQINENFKIQNTPHYLRKAPKQIGLKAVGTLGSLQVATAFKPSENNSELENSLNNLLFGAACGVFQGVIYNEMAKDVRSCLNKPIASKNPFIGVGYGAIRDSISQGLILETKRHQPDWSNEFITFVCSPVATTLSHGFHNMQLQMQANGKNYSEAFKTIVDPTNPVETLKKWNTGLSKRLAILCAVSYVNLRYLSDIKQDMGFE